MTSAFSFNAGIYLLNYFLLASPLSCSFNFFNRTISAFFFNNSRSNFATLYSNCSIGVKFFLFAYFANGFPGLRLFTSASSPPSKYCLVHLCICESLIPVSLANDNAVSPSRLRNTSTNFSSLLWLLFVPPFGRPILFISFFLSYHKKNDGRHFFVSTIIISFHEGAFFITPLRRGRRFALRCLSFRPCPRRLPQRSLFPLPVIP